MRAVLLTLTMCLLALPAQATYGSGSGTLDAPCRIATAAERIDQSNLPEWTGGWTNVNPGAEGRAAMWQTFTPACPNLIAVEIDILTIGPGRGDDVLTVEIAREGTVLASTARSVEDGFDGLLRFEFPEAVPLVPEQLYELTVRDTGATRFGWKYGSNTYERGSRYVNAQQQLGYDWLFRTYAGTESAATRYSGGAGEPNDPYQIATAADLIALGETPDDYDKHFILTADIDLDPNLPGRKVFGRAVIAPDMNDVRSWYQGTLFSGTFDGNDHKISNLTIDGSEYLGLFGRLAAEANISNLGLEAIDVNGTKSYLGGLTGANGGSITNCYAVGTVYSTGTGATTPHVGGSTYRSGSCVGGLTGSNNGDIVNCRGEGTASGYADVGGLVGENSFGSISSSSTAGTVRGMIFVGGLVGCNDNSSITRSYSTATVHGDGNVGGLVGVNWLRSNITTSYSTGRVTGFEWVGGLVGRNGDGNSNPWYSSISDCYSDAIVIASHHYAGGLVGYNDYGNITTSCCRSTAVISGDRYVGGLVGWHAYGSINDCYSAATVSGESSVGGIAGANWRGRIGASFWDMSITTVLNMCGYADGTGCDDLSGKTTVEMQMARTFLEADWDFAGEAGNGTEDVWWIFEGRDYPRLWWERVAEDDFADGEAGPLWFVYAPEPELVQIEEINGRLEVNTAGSMENVDAIYVANGWQLDTTKDFAMRVDFHFGRQDGHDGRVTLGIGPSLDPLARQWAEFEAGRFDTGPFYLYEVSDGDWVQERVTERLIDDGTLYMSYNCDADELYFSDKGYGKANAWETVPDLLKGRWNSEPVYIILGGGSEGMALTGEDAWLDNLIVNSGTLIPSEPDDENGPDEEEPDFDADWCRFGTTRAAADNPSGRLPSCNAAAHPNKVYD